MPGRATSVEIAKYAGQLTVSAIRPQGEDKKVRPMGITEHSPEFPYLQKESWILKLEFDTFVTP